MELSGLDPERVEAVLLRYGGAGPRYTSYPTAPAWSASYDARCFAEDLAGLAPGAPLSLYVHVPFCRSLCHFCACNRMITHDPALPERYRAVGQPVVIPGSMGTASYVLAGTDAGLALSFGSTCHGAGRAMSRGAAKRARTGAEVRHELEARGIIVRCPSSGELAEEAPTAYKDVERVVDVVHRAGLARTVARLRPLGVVKG